MNQRCSGSSKMEKGQLLENRTFIKEYLRWQGREAGP